MGRKASVRTGIQRLSRKIGSSIVLIEIGFVAVTYSTEVNSVCREPYDRRDLEARDPQAYDTTSVCSWKKITLAQPYGIEKLDGTMFNGVTREDIAWNVSVIKRVRSYRYSEGTVPVPLTSTDISRVIQAINSWKRNGRANGWSTLNYDYNDQADLDAMISGDLSKQMV